VYVQEATEVAPTEKEVALAKSETLNSFVFNFASTSAQMQRVAAYTLLGIPEVIGRPITLAAACKTDRYIWFLCMTYRCVGVYMAVMHWQ